MAPILRGLTDLFGDNEMAVLGLLFVTQIAQRLLAAFIAFPALNRGTCLI